jgi:hypothetical protein
MVGEWQHFPEQCPLCADMFNPATTPVTYDDCIKHLLYKVSNLEGRLQDIEWRNTPLGPNRIQDVHFDEERLDAIRKVVGRQEPDCAICYDEEGSWACLRAAHGKMKNV